MSVSNSFTTQIVFSILYILLLICPISWCIADHVSGITQDTDAFANETFQIKKILIIEPPGYAEAHGQGIHSGIQSVLDPISTVRYTTESLRADSYRNIIDYNTYLEAFSDPLLMHYPGAAFDAIIAVNDDVLDFLQKYRDTLFPDIPIISSSVYVSHPSELRERDIAFVHGSSIEKTLELMMTQYPNARSLYVLLSSSQSGANTHRIIDEFIASHPNWIDTYYFASSHLTYNDLLAEMNAIPDMDLVLLQGYDFSDEFGGLYPILQSAPGFISEIDAPFYVISDTYNEKGVVGGFEVELKELGIVLANAALEVVHTAEAGPLPNELRVRDIEPKPIFIHEALERFGISQSSLPLHAVVVGRSKISIPISSEVLYGGSILLVIFFLIACVLIYEEIKIKRANTEVIKEKDLLAQLVANIPSGISIIDAQDQRKHLIFNDKLGDILGIDPKEVLGKFFPLEPLRIDEHRGESLSARCIRTRSMSESEFVYVTPSGYRTLHAFCYPTFNENEDVQEIIVHFIDRTEERALERELENSLRQFKSLFEQDIVAIGLYEPVYDNGNVTSFRYLDINSEYERLTGISRDNLSNKKMTKENPYFVPWYQVISEKKSIHFQNWNPYGGNKYLSGYLFLFGGSREYLCVTARDTTHIVRLRKNEQMLVEQINANIKKLNALNTEMRQPLYEIQELLANEEDSAYLSIIKEQLNIIIMCIDELERGFIKSEKIQLYLMKHNNIREFSSMERQSQ